MKKNALAEAVRTFDAEERFVNSAQTEEQATARREQVRKIQEWRGSADAADPNRRLRLLWGNVSNPSRNMAITAAEIDELAATGAKRVVVNVKKLYKGQPEAETRHAVRTAKAMIALALPNAEVHFVRDATDDAVVRVLRKAAERASRKADRGRE